MTRLTCLVNHGYPVGPMDKLSGTLLGLLLLSSCVYEPPTPASNASGQDTSSSSSSGTTTSSGSAGGGGGGGGAGVSSSSSSSSSATGGGGATGEPPCHPAGLEDGFDGSAVDTSLWTPQGKQPIMSVSGSQLRVTPEENVNDDQFVGLVTKLRYDLKGCAVWIEAPSIVKNGAAGSTYWQLYTPDGSTSFKVANGNLDVKVGDTVGMLGQASFAYIPSEHRWWRIREAGGILIMETSPDFITWTTLLTTQTPSYIAQVAIGLGVVSPMNQTNLGQTTFDHFNIKP